MKKIILLALIVINATMSTAQSEIEPNDWPNYHAVSLPISLTGNTISSSGDEDWFQVIVPDGVIEVYKPQAFATFTYRITIRASNGLTIISEVEGSGQGSEIKNQAVVQAGTYYIEVERHLFGSGSWSSGALYDLNISFDATDTCEFNNLPTYAHDIPVNTQIHAKIWGYNAVVSGRDDDYYKVHIPKCGVMQIVIPNNNTGIQLRAQLTDSTTNNVIHTGTAASIGGSINYERMVQPGTYLIQVDGYQGVSQSDEPYYLTVNYDTTDQGGCNTAFNTAHPMNICESSLGTIRPVTNDKDFFSFVGDGNPITLSTTNVPNDLTLKMSLYDNNQTFISPAYTGLTGQNVVSSAISTVSGQTYYVKVEELNNQKSNLPYTFAITNSSCPTAIKKTHYQNTQKIFPNPTTGKLYIQGGKGIEKTISLRNVIGQLLYIAESNAELSEISIDLANGIYFVTINTDENSHTEKIIVSR